MNTPEIFQVYLDYAGYILFENERLFEGVREHLPFYTFSDLWNAYASWKTRRAEYIDTCKTLRKQIKGSWAMQGVELASSFEQPVLRLIAGVDKELRFNLFVSVGHDLAELKHQWLDVNDTEVVRGRECSAKLLQMLKDEECSKVVLAREYQKIADHFLHSDIATQAKQLLLESRGLEIRIRGFLQDTLLRRDYIMGTCKFCPGQARPPR